MFAFIAILIIPLTAWTIQACVSLHRSNMRQMRRDMPALFGRDNAIRVWFGF